MDSFSLLLIVLSLMLLDRVFFGFSSSNLELLTMRMKYIL